MVALQLALAPGHGHRREAVLAAAGDLVGLEVLEGGDVEIEAGIPLRGQPLQCALHLVNEGRVQVQVLEGLYAGNGAAPVEHSRLPLGHLFKESPTEGGSYRGNRPL